MHIGLASDQYPPYPLGGVGARVTDLARGLVNAGHRVTVAGVYPRNRNVTRLLDERIDGVRVLRIPPAPQWMRWRPGALWDRYQLRAHLRRVHRETPFDLVEFTDGFGQAFFGAPPGVPMAIRLDGTVKLFDSQMGIDGDRFIYWMEKKALDRPDFFSAPSRFAKRETFRVFGIPERPCEIIPNAVDVRIFSPGAEPAEPGLIVFANSIEPRKGVRELVLAMNEVCESHSYARLLLIGSDTQLRDNGRTYSEQLLDSVKPQFRSRVIFAGRLDRETGVLPWLRKAHLCCYPSRVETFGVAPLEAMAVGKPVIYSSAGPGPEVIEDGVSGLLCKIDPSSIAAAVRRIIDNPPFAESLGRNARARAVSLFAKDAWIQRNLQFYQACIAAYASRT